MNTDWLRNILAVLTFSIASTGAVRAETHGTIPFSDHGIIDSALVDGSLVISDRVFRLGDSAVVRELDGKPVSMTDLKLKTKVGFNVYGARAPYFISEIWILPRTFDFRSLDED
ncbi:hypothetical protein [Aquamicrobium sp.]|uniref:hypothetical protein n=1 Tax=Aquamicrobium sp. TaxID=1872579 RepID=UPI002587F8AA|nr:hypothetical protein [Aquamicrobium sp.]MCK9553528.1 hypothetical protein [Aquamicrobium sp.]